jgi:Kef-type K+ transport system membrane component KefB
VPQLSAGAFAIPLIVAAAVLLACALGAPLFARIRQPRVVAELCVGILVGFGLAQGTAALGIPIPLPQVKAVLYWISEPALLAYMFCLGYETNVAHLRDGLARSSSIAASRIVVAFTLTYCLLSLNLAWGIDQASSVGGKLAICGAMAVTAFPVMARILDELKMLGSRVGLTALSAAAVDDLFAWTLLAVLGAIATGSAAGIDPIIVAFAAGLLTPRMPFVSEALRHVQRWATRLMPLFFALAGMNAVIAGWLTALPAIALWTAWATLTTAGASYVSARANQFDRQSSLTIAALMNCRGVVGLIFLSVGLRNGLITQHTYAVLLAVALATTFMTTPIVVLAARLRRGSVTGAAGQPAGALLAEV